MNQIYISNVQFEFDFIFLAPIGAQEILICVHSFICLSSPCLSRALYFHPKYTASYLNFWPHLSYLLT